MTDQPEVSGVMTGQVPVADKRVDMRLQKCDSCGVAHQGECAHERGSE